MRRRHFAAGPLMALATAVTLAACGGGSSSSSSSGGSTSAAGASSSIQAGGGSFCDQIKSVIAQVKQLVKTVVPSTPGATPDINGFKTLIGAITSAVDQLDSAAPAEIAQAFHTFRAAYDQANSQAQAATTIQQFDAAFATINTDAVKGARDQLYSYGQNTCGINPSGTP